MEELLGDLNEALTNPSGKVLQGDKLWESLFYIRSKETFINCWTFFLCVANSPVGSPVLYQHLCKQPFSEIITLISAFLHCKPGSSTTRVTGLTIAYQQLLRHKCTSNSLA